MCLFKYRKSCFKITTFISGENVNDGEETEPDLKTILQRLKPRSSSPQRLTIMRENVFEDSIAFFKQRNFDFTVPLKITFENEPAIDGGGPVREYFILLTRNLLSSSTTVYLRDETHAFSPSYSRLLGGW